MLITAIVLDLLKYIKIPLLFERKIIDSHIDLTELFYLIIRHAHTSHTFMSYLPHIGYRQYTITHFWWKRVWNKLRCSVDCVELFIIINEIIEVQNVDFKYDRLYDINAEKIMHFLYFFFWLIPSSSSNLWTYYGV